MLNDSDVSGTLCSRDYKDGGKRVIVADYRNDEGLRIREDGCSPTLFNDMRGESKEGDVTKRILIITHSLQQRSIERPSIQEALKQGKPIPGGFGHLSKDDGTSYTLDGINSQAIEYNKNIRRLTPKECFRLMGFLDDEINIKGLSDTQCYKLAGNGWDINLVSKILKKLFKNNLKR
jgi:site-specific DNA-cytosine methylase